MKSIKGRGTSRKNDEGGLLGWEDDDYLKVNKRLIETGQKFKESFYKKKKFEKRRVMNV